jgi:hypothetical protein
MPNSLITIEPYAFEYCSDLSSVTIPNSVTSIGTNAFFNSGLTGITIGSGVTSIGANAFEGSGLTSIFFLSNAPSADLGFEYYGINKVVYYVLGTTGWGSSFEGQRTMLWDPSSQLSYVTNDNSITIFKYVGSGGAANIPSSIGGMPVTSIGNNAFYQCTGLTSVTIPNTVTSIGTNAFFNTGLTSITVGSGVTNIESGAFADCTALTNITLPDSVISIGEGAFQACNNVTNVTLGTNITSIGNNAFWGCPNLSNITIPSSVTSIGDYAFYECYGLTGIYFLGNAPTLGSFTFYYDTNAVVYYVPGTTGWSSTFGGLPAYSNNLFTYQGISSGIIITGFNLPTRPSVLTIPSTINGIPVTSIGVQAFLNCSNLTSVTIPASLTFIYGEAFGGCANLKTVMFEGNAPSVAYGPGLNIFNGDSSVTVYYLAGTTGWNTFYTNTGVPIVLFAPTIQITTPTAGLQVSNASYTITGNANGILNVAVSNVFYSLNNAAWTNATTVNNWTNWTATVNLIAGTNTIQACAVDTNGNISTTKSVSFYAFLNTQLTVNTNGSGTFSPNYNGASLYVGSPYSITAMAGTGFAFTNWTGGILSPLTVLTNGATLQFVMQSNLVLQANFVDVQKPTNSITSPTPGQSWSNGVFTVTGKASDNVAVSNVWYSLNNAAWTGATTANNWSTWTATINLIAGTNTIQAYALDTSGNISATNNVSFNAVLSTVLTVSTNGLGSITPNDNGQSLIVGKSYSMAAKAATGFVFTNWTGGIGSPQNILTNGLTVNFVMQSNLWLQANFQETSKPTLTVSSPTNNKKLTNALANLIGTTSDNWKVGGVWNQLNGGAWSLASTTNSFTNWTATLTLIAGTNTIKSFAQNWGGIFSTTNNLSVISSNTFMLQLIFTNTLPMKTNGLVFSLQLSTGLDGHIQVSTNLTSWATLTNFVGTNSTITFRDPAATNSPSRFYRAVIP